MFIREKRYVYKGETLFVREKCYVYKGEVLRL